MFQVVTVHITTTEKSDKTHNMLTDQYIQMWTHY